MTPIERVARAIAPELWDGYWLDKEVQASEQAIAMCHAEDVLRAAFPGLMSDPPTEWLAPMEPTDAMWNAMQDKIFHERTPEECWGAARDSHLKDTPTP